MPLAHTARQFWIRAPGHAEIRRSELAPPGVGEVLVRARYSGISRGTEALVFRGEVPRSQYAAMRAPFQEGALPGPITYGYSSVGTVEEGPDHLAGRTVFCLHPHQDFYCVPEHAVHPLPEQVPAPRAVLAANMETAVNIVWDARPAAGDVIVVIGGGVVGLLAASLCRDLPGVSVTVVDPNHARAAVAESLGLGWQADAPAGAAVDLVIHASGNPEGLRAALEVAGPEATIVEASWFGTREVALQLGGTFHAGRLQIQSSQVGRVPVHRASRWTAARRLGLALRLLADERLEGLITGESGFDELPAVLAALARNPGDALCHRIRYGDAPGVVRGAAGSPAR